MNEVKLVVFDLDGTLVDSDKTVIRILNTIRKDLTLPALKLKDISSVLSLGGEEMIKKIIGNGLDVKKYLEIFRQRYLEDSLNNENLFDGVINYLKHLESKNIQMAVFTNKPKDLTKKTLKRHQIYNFFNYILTSDDLEFKKPSPDGCYKLIEMSSILPQNIIMIGDSELDQKAANSASIPFFYHNVLSNEQTVAIKSTKIFNNFNDLID
ncbi:HAD family hydrolase [Methylophilaceae bacterium]|jgi:phosphoglycolate phosphatase|nr:HAD family hydrolase [Methylophilaceae bacterium]|tara:strand:- start:9775 stop:10404 length:630 start_codon:yes stop_codon:yes gene_type:complete